MFFNDSEIVLELLGIFKIKRQDYIVHNACIRSYDTLSIRSWGTCEFAFENTDITVKNGDLLYIPSNINYSQKTFGEEIIAVHFINYNKQNNFGIEIFTPDNPDKMCQKFEEIYKIWNERKAGFKQKCTSLLYDILYFSAQKIEERNFPLREGNKLMNEAINYIHQNYKNEDISISQISKHLYVSDTYFRRLFKQSFGISPNKYINSLKLEYASQLLASGFYSVNEVSVNAGFSDSKYFSRIFKNRYSKSPREYKKQFQKTDHFSR